jgi:hypothetical protein
MQRSSRVAIAATLISCAVGITSGAWLALRERAERPDWYVDPATNRIEYAALRRRASATPAAEFPPNAATLAYLRNAAVGSASDPDEKLDDARVYRGSGYVLQLRGRFSTAGIPRPPSAHRPHVTPPFCPCVTLGLDPSTLVAMSVAVGKCEDLSFLGNSIDLLLHEERG